MKFFDVKQKALVRKTKTYPYVVLRSNNWDDYGYKTTFFGELFLEEGQSIELGELKILKSDQKGGYTTLPKMPFSSLGTKYCSLGQSFDYYEDIYKLKPSMRRQYLKSIGDVCFNDTRLSKFEEKEGFKVSLLRFSGSERLIQDAQALLTENKTMLPQKKRGFRLRFETQLGPNADSFTGNFNFNRKGQLPNRVNALIGYNGSGKTKLLSNLAVIASEYGYNSKEDHFDRTAGRFIRPRPPVTKVVVISYSAFDTFVIPNDDEAERVGYIYCGLRRRLNKKKTKKVSDTKYMLKSPQEIESDFLNSVNAIFEAGRKKTLREVLRPILKDTSFSRIKFKPLLDELDGESLSEFFNDLSSGHKIVVKIIIDLVHRLDGDEPNLVLIDEPETHLHPPLVATLLRSVRVALNELNGFCILATHSPVVLQEIPSRYVRVVRRIGDATTFDHPEIQTFGEAVGLITQVVFNVDDTSTVSVFI